MEDEGGQEEEEENEEKQYAAAGERLSSKRIRKSAELAQRHGRTSCVRSDIPQGAIDTNSLFLRLPLFLVSTLLTPGAMICFAPPCVHTHGLPTREVQQ